jgi:hypothetical protein
MNDTYFDHQLTIEQLTKLLHAAKAGRRGDRDHLMILLGVSHGMRNSEICNLAGCGKTRFGADAVPRNSLVSTAQPDKKKACVEKTSSSWMCSAT